MLQHLDLIPNPNGTARRIRDEVLAEQHFAVSIAIFGEGLQRLLPRLLTRDLINCRYYTPGAWLDDVEFVRAYANAFPGVFFKRLGTRNDKVRSKAVHRDRVLQARVQIRERAFADQQKREGIGKADRVLKDAH